MKKILSLSAFCLATIVHAQVEEKQHSPFSSLLSNPIQMEVQNNGLAIEFFGINKSTYPYQVIIKFTNLTNLKFYGDKKEFLLEPGRSKVLTLNKYNEDDLHHYSYTISYNIGDPKKRTDPDYEYLVPVRNRNLLILHNSLELIKFHYRTAH